MAISVGVIGTGNIGQDHIRRITQALAGARVVAVTDIDSARAQRIAKELGGRAETTGQKIIAAEDVDAVIVTSIGSTHEEFVLAAIASGKPVFCEKPLATTAATCKRILDIQCELVGETGVARLPEPANVPLRSEAKLSVEILTDWKKRFIGSYDVELQEWIHSVASGKISGPSSWDGYAAAVTADACVEAQKTGKIVEIKLGSRPVLYQ